MLDGLGVALPRRTGRVAGPLAVRAGHGAATRLGLVARGAAEAARAPGVPAASRPAAPG